MAFLSRKKEEDALKSEQILLDATLMQNLQDRFCDANNLIFKMSCQKSHGSNEDIWFKGRT